MPYPAFCSRALITLRLCLLLGLIAPLAHADFAAASSDVPADESVRYGMLANGFRYALKTNAEPRERVSLRLLIETGSLQETEDQRGVAHFLEHMAFNGSENYAPGTLIEFFQRMGMNFGGDTNAFTSFDRTVYMIDLPDANPEHLKEGLAVFYDYADNMLLLPEEIDRERGIVLSEKRSRDSVEWRSFLAEMEFFFPGTRVFNRIPIGTEEVLTQAPRETFVDYYNTWYRPERMALVAVGDFDLSSLEQKIIDQFSSLQARGPARNGPPLDQVEVATGLAVLHHHEPEAGGVTVGIQTLTPYTEEPDTIENRLKYLPRDLAFAMLNRRLSELAKKENSPFSGGRANAGVAYDIARNVTIELGTQVDRWQDALPVAENELRRALEFGFQRPELREVVAGMRNGLEQAVKRAATRQSSGLAMGILSSIADDNVFTTPQTNYDLFMPALDAVTVEDCVKAFRDAWDVPHRFVTVIGNTGAEQPANPEATIAALYRTAHATPLEAPAAIKEEPFGYVDFGPAGEIFRREYVEDLDLTQVEFANRVRLNIKKTDFSAESIRLSIRVGSGRLTEPTDQEGIGVFASNTFTAGGLGLHSADDLRRILAGRNVGVGFGVDDDAFILSGGTTPDDLLLQLQLATAYLVDPAYRPEAGRQMMKAIIQYFTRLAHQPQGPLQTEVPRLLANGDVRFGLPSEATLTQRSLAEVREWLTPEFEHGAIEIGLVGDLDVDATIAAVAQTLGALPPRKSKPALTEARQVSFPTKAFDKAYTVPTEIPKGIVSIFWPTTDGKDAPVSRRLGVLAQVLDDRLRLKIREELGGAYSPGAGSSASDTYDGYGSINAFVEVDPPDAKKIAKVNRDIAHDLHRKGINDDELDRAIQPILTSLRQSARSNNYWLNAVLASAQEFPQRLDWARSRYSDYESITVAEIDALAKAYLDEDDAFQFIVLPEE